MELFMKYPIEVQNELLHDLLKTAATTEMGIENEFQSIKSYTLFKERVPISSYESIASTVERCRRGEQNIFWPTP